MMSREKVITAAGSVFYDEYVFSYLLLPSSCDSRQWQDQNGIIYYCCNYMKLIWRDDLRLYKVQKEMVFKRPLG